MGSNSRARRLLCLALAGALVSLPACNIPWERAHRDLARIDSGFPLPEVLRILGDPTKVIPDEDGAMWVYRYERPGWLTASLAFPIVLTNVILVTLNIVLYVPVNILKAVFSRGKAKGFDGFPLLGFPSKPHSFRVHFDLDEILDARTPVERCREHGPVGERWEEMFHRKARVEVGMNQTEVLVAMAEEPTQVIASAESPGYVWIYRYRNRSFRVLFGRDGVEWISPTEEH